MLPELGCTDSVYRPATTKYSIMLWRDPVERFESFVSEFQLLPYTLEKYVELWPDIMNRNYHVDHRSLPVDDMDEETDWTWWHLLPQTNIVGAVDDHTHVFHVSEFNTALRDLLMDITGRSLSERHARRAYRPSVKCNAEQRKLLEKHYWMDYANLRHLTAS